MKINSGRLNKNRMSKTPFTRLDKDLSLSEKIEQQIIEAIRKKFFLPGDKLLSENELSLNFGVSRTVIREALHRLAGRGVVEIRKNSGVFVSTDQYTSVTDSFYHLLEMKSGKSSLLNIADVRIIIEPEIARQAAGHRSEEDLEKMRDSYKKMESYLNDPQKMIRHDIDFHRAVAKAANNPIFPVMMEPLFLLMTKFISNTYEYPQSPVLALKSHHAILESIEAKDGDGAFHAMKNHMNEGKSHAKIISEKNNQTKTLKK